MINIVQAKKLRDEYLKNFNGLLSAAASAYQSARDHCAEIKDEVRVYVSSVSRGSYYIRVSNTHRIFCTNMYCVK